MNAEDFKTVFGEGADVCYFPIRHHSPACSFHLQKAIERFSPDCVLIEGPEDADHMIKYLQSDGVVPPVCIYSSYDDKNGDVLGGEGEKYRAYYPFLACSPEFAAIKTAARMGIPAHFIDMPYPLQLTQFGARGGEVRRFGDDAAAEYYRLAAEKSGCRSFAEFWESGFEIGGCEKDTEDFARSVFLLGLYLRKLSPADESCLYRECYMRENIRKMRREFKKIMVVTGAYHTAGLAEGGETLAFKGYKKSDSALYLMPYSFAETDSASGYGAGIPFPAFYSEVWKRLSRGETDAYGKTVEEYIPKIARRCADKNAMTIPDEAQALYMAKELAALRGRTQPGAYELIDGVTSAFVKGDIDSAAAFEPGLLYGLLTGLGAGEVNVGGGEEVTPPCVIDFRAKCRKYRINLGAVAKQETVLDVVKNQRHYEKSCFLHRMAYLGTGFCKMKSGPDYVRGKNTSLVREHWSIRFSTAVESALTDLSVYGTSVERICLALLKKQFAAAASSADAGEFLLKTYVTGFSRRAAELMPEIAEVIRSDSDFLSQNICMTRLNRLIGLQKNRLAETDKGSLGLLKISFFTALNKLGDVKNASGEEEFRVCGGIRLMNSLSSDFPEVCERSAFLEEIKKCSDGADCSPQIYGVCLMICEKAGLIGEETCCEIISGYMTSADADSSAGFLIGVISAGRDIIFTGEKPLLSIDEALRKMDGEKFRAALPHLRMAFTAFLPSETARIAKRVSKLYGADERELFGSEVFSADEILAASERDRKVGEMMKKWGLL